MNKKNKNHIALITICTLLSGNSFAQVVNIDPDAVPFSMSIGAQVTDNFNPTTVLESEANGYTVSIGGQLVNQSEGFEILLGYDAKNEGFSVDEQPQNEDDSFHSYSVMALSRLHFSKSWHIDAQIDYKNEKQQFGQGVSRLRNDVIRADEVSETQGTLALVYGNDVSSRYFAISASIEEEDFDDNNAYSSLFDITKTSLSFDSAFKRSSATRYLFRLKATDEDYDSELRDDGMVYTALVGMEWQPTGNTSLEALVGAFSQDRDGMSSNSGISWVFKYTGTPRDDFKFAIESARSAKTSELETTGNSVEQNLSVDLTYMFSDRWEFSGGVAFSETEFEELPSSRELDEFKAQLGITLAFTDYNSFTLLLEALDVSSSDDLIDYQQNTASLMWRYEF